MVEMQVPLLEKRVDGGNGGGFARGRVLKRIVLW